MCRRVHSNYVLLFKVLCERYAFAYWWFCNPWKKHRKLTAMVRVYTALFKWGKMNINWGTSEKLIVGHLDREDESVGEFVEKELWVKDVWWQLEKEDRRLRDREKLQKLRIFFLQWESVWGRERGEGGSGRQTDWFGHVEWVQGI